MHFSIRCTLLALLIGLLLGGGRAAAQEISPDVCATGTVYYIALPDTVANVQDGRFTSRLPRSFLLHIYSSQAQEVTISSPEGGQEIVPVGASEMIVFDMERVGVPLISLANVPSRKTLTVNATFPIVVTAYIVTPFGCAAFAPVPVEGWGAEYVVPAWPGETVRNLQPPNSDRDYNASQKVAAPAEIVIVAAIDNTHVLIEPAGALAECDDCRRVTLNSGEAYRVTSLVDTNDGATPNDIAGTRITTDKMIGVISGNTRAQIVPPTTPMLAGNSVKDLMMEWLHPVEAHGRSFIFMPSIDEHHQGAEAAERRAAEYVRIHPSGDTVTAISLIGRDGNPIAIDESPLQPGGIATETLRDIDSAHAYVTSGPAALYQSPKPFSRFEGMTVNGGIDTAVRHRSGGSFMVEMTPREQWTTFAPFRVPTNPKGMRHYVNVVTDLAGMENVVWDEGGAQVVAFPFNRGLIPGTDLVWGSVELDTGKTYRLKGIGVRFGGYAYGTMDGGEAYAQVTGLPTMYDETIGLSYGYPLAPRHCRLYGRYAFSVSSSAGSCGEERLSVQLFGPDAGGIASVGIDDAGSSPPVNTRIEFVTPSDSSALSSERLNEVVVRLKPIDSTRDAEAWLTSREKIGGLTNLFYYRYIASGLTLESSEPTHFSGLVTGETAEAREVYVQNNSGRATELRTVRFSNGTRGFRIVRTWPDYDITNGSSLLFPSQSLILTVDVTPTIPEGIVRDTIEIDHGCGVVFRLPLSARIGDEPVDTTDVDTTGGSVENPCLRTSDLDFGLLRPGERRSLPLQICNVGSGLATFADSAAEILSWLAPEFEVSDADLERLRTALLDSGECIVINVAVTAGAETGLFRTTAHVRTSNPGCRDSSLWTARVANPGGHADATDWGATWLSAEESCTKCKIVEYERRVVLANTGEKPIVFDSLVIGNDPDGAFRFGDVGLARGDTLAPGDTSSAAVIFKPMVMTEYRATLTLHSTTPSSGESTRFVTTLDGEGTESCVQAADIVIEGQYNAVTPRSSRTRVIVHSTGTRPLLIRRATLIGPDTSEFAVTEMTEPFGPTPFFIPPGERTEFEIVFTPKSGDTRTREVVFSLTGDFADAGCAGSCSDSAVLIRGVVGTSGVDEGGAAGGISGLTVSPNPATDELSIGFTLHRASDLHIGLYDASGRAVAVVGGERMGVGTHRVRFDLSELPSGVYMVRLSGEGIGEEVRRVVIVR